MNLMSKLSRNRKTNNLNISSLIYKGLVIVMALLPLFVIPIKGIAPSVGKVLLVEFGAISLLLLWLIGQILSKKIKIEKSKIGYGFVLFSLAVLISSLLSSDFGISFFGESFGVGEGLFLFSIGTLGFLSTQVFRDFQRVIVLYISAIISFVVLAFHQLLRLIVGGNFLSFGVLPDTTTTLLGSWSEFGVFAGFSLIIALAGIEFLKIKKHYKTMLWVVVILAGITVLVVNITLAWLLVAVAAFILFLYKAAFRENSHKTKWRLPVASLTVFIFALFGHLFVGDLVSPNLIPSHNVMQPEIRLSIGVTAQTVSKAWDNNFLTGVGPNNFGYLWQKTRNSEISRLALSDKKFEFGYSTLATFVGTLGILGGLIIILLLAYFLKLGGNLFTRTHENRIKRFFILSAFVLSLYLWAVLFFYTPSSVILTYSFAFMGVFAGLVGLDQKNKKCLEIPLLGDKKYSASILIIFVVTVFLAGAAYVNTKNTAGMFAFRKGVFSQDAKSGYEAASRAAKLSSNSIYYRSLATFMRDQASSLNAQADVSLDEEARSELEAILAQMLSYSKSATIANSYDYSNWSALGDTYSVLSTYDVADSHIDAQEAYGMALERNPYAHDVLARMAVSEINNDNWEIAEQIVTGMLVRRPGDIDALVLAARIAYQSDEREEEADFYLIEAAKLSSGNINILFEIGLFAYNQSRFGLAKDIFAGILSVDSANADAALGLMSSLEELGEKDEAEKVRDSLIAGGIITADGDRELPDENKDQVDQQSNPGDQ